MELKMDIASILYWKAGATREEIDSILKDLKDKGLIWKDTTDSYNYDWGTPVWYIP